MGNNRIKQIIRKPSLLFFTLGHRGFLNWMSDEKYLKIAYKIKIGKKLFLNNPQTFNEKMQWLKIYDRNPMYTQMVDKIEAKKIVSRIIGEKYIIPTLNVWDNFDDINFDDLPEQFVLKCSHDSGGLVICKNKNDLDIKAARKKINRSLKRNFFWSSREWPYKNIKPRILAEKYIEQPGFKELPVFKIFNFNGNPKLIQVIQGDKSESESIDYFDTSWKKLDLRQNFPNSKEPLSKPLHLEDMLENAKKISKDIPFVRTDFYEVDGNVYFSECTFYSDSGLARFNPEEWDEELGKLIELPNF